MSDDSPSLILVEEVRLGLFRIYCEIEEAKWDKEDVYKQQFELCGSQKERKYRLNFELQLVGNKKRPYHFQIEIEDLLCTDENYSKTEEKANKSQQEEQQQSKRKKLDKLTAPSNMLPAVFPIYMWLDSHVSSTNEMPLMKAAEGIWRVEVINPYAQPYITVWMDFGTNEMKETRVIKRLLYMYYNQQQCDVEFDFNDGQSVGAHIVILSASSSVFAAMFQSNLSETKTRKVTIVDAEIRVFKQFLIFLYTDNAPKMAEEGMARLLFELSDKYDVVNLKHECVDMLLTQLNIENVIDMLVWAHFHSIGILSEKAMEFLVKNFRKLCNRPQWKELLKCHPDLFLRATQQLADLLPESSDSE
jgi:speckle-type POZ protein